MAVNKMTMRSGLWEVDANLHRGSLRRKTGNGHGTTLAVADAGLLAIGIELVIGDAMDAIRKHRAEAPMLMLPSKRTGTEQAMLVALLPRPEAAMM